LEEKLKEVLKNGKDWARVNTSIRGIGLLKLPTFRGYPAKLVVEINPIDELGRSTKRRGLILKSTEELETFKKLLAEDKLNSLLQNIEKICGKIETKKEEIIQLD
jgi:hypothetical protein